MRLLFVLLSVLGTSVLAQDYIDGSYVIRFKDDFIKTTLQEKRFVHTLKRNYNIELKKIFRFPKASLLHIATDESTAEILRNLPEVQSVHQDAMAYTTQTCAQNPSPGTWGLDRMDQRGVLDDRNPLSDAATYVYGERTGDLSYAYVADTGIEITNHEFEGRAIWGYTASGIGTPGEANNYHGTHCAGTIGSASYGVAKDATLVAVKVLSDSGSGPWTSVVDGMNWIRADHERRKSEAGGAMPRSSVNLSLGGSGQNLDLQVAIDALIDAGVVVAASAGNNGGDACNQSPAFIPRALTIAASDVDDNAAGFTNWGSCVDIFAPGVDVLSTSLNNGTSVASGTSMSCPHVVGLVARYQSTQDPAPSPAEVEDWMTDVQATRDALNLSGNDASSPNKLIYANC